MATKLRASPGTLAIVSQPGEFGQLTAALRPGVLAVDTETTGLDWMIERVGGVSFAAGDTAVYCYGDALDPAVRWLSDQAKVSRAMVFHNAKFDLHFLRATFGLHIPYPVHDTLLMSFLDDNRGAPVSGTHRLKDLASAYISPEAKAPQDDLLASVTANGGHGPGDYLLGDPQLLGRYAAFDAWYTHTLFDHFRARLKETPQSPRAIQSVWDLYENERWLLLALVDMEARGVKVDVGFLERWKTSLTTELAATEKTLRRKAGVADLNWNATAQLKALLYGKLKLTPVRFTPGGKPSTDEVALLRLNHPVGHLILKCRELSKQLSTYAINLLEAVKSDGRIHCSFKQTGAETGRLSASDPNLQNQTRESGARKAIVVDPGLHFYFGDYSQVEMRFAAHLANDATLITGFQTDPNFDTHRATAQKMYGIPEPTKRQRKFAKIMNFGMLYGAGEDRIEEQLLSMLSRDEALQGLKEFGVTRAQETTPHRQLSQLLLQRYFTEFPSVKTTRYRFSNEVRNVGYTINLFGRRRYLDEDQSYKAFNTHVQGDAADQAKRGLVALYRELQLAGKIALVLQIHDEAVYLSDDDPATHRRALELLADTTTFRVPIVAGMECSTTSWQEKQPWTDPSSSRRAK